MTTGLEKLSRTMQGLDDADAVRPKPSAAFHAAVAEYVYASRRLSAAQRSLLAHLNAYEVEVRSADDDPDEPIDDAVPNTAAQARKRAFRDATAVNVTSPGFNAGRRPSPRNRRS